MRVRSTNYVQAAIAACTLSILYLIPVFAQPDTVWTRELRDRRGNQIDCDPYALKVISTSSGKIVIGSTSGNERNDGVYDHDFRIAQCDSIGRLEWTHTYGGVYHGQYTGEDGYSICETPDSGYVYAGNSFSATVLRTNRRGDTL